MLTSFRDVLKRAARTLGIEPAVHLAEAQRVWPEIVGPVLAPVTRLQTVRGEILIVGAAHPLAAQEVQLRREEILARLRVRLPGVELHQVRVVIRADAGRKV